MSPCHSKSPLKLNIVSIMADNLMAKWVAHPFCPSKCLSKRSKEPVTKTATLTARVSEALRPHIGSVFVIVNFRWSERRARYG